MYVPSRFASNDAAFAARVIAENAFGLLITCGAEAPQATPIPFLYRRDEGEFGTLYGHVARANPQWRAFDGKTQALATFLGPHGYVSPLWYAAKEAVPTWNYVAVHATGIPRLLDEPETRVLLDRLAASFEDARAPWTMASQSAEFIRAKIKGIAAFALPVAKLEAKAKLGQDRHRADSLGAVRALRERGNLALAELMERAAQPDKVNA
jgi:transcriptional regulator